ncbi:hypothetical protein RR49_00311 [Microbacterium ginsengisoli]|uniref:Uncharacterized protein n=1 Tax=Microbacterium ginsengisoli TaxID=400772 RepID=A0A0F0M357_9MICO|nr:hypothetical protein [Microbacterium ginsengisoli]KJL42013.1 hypothetical protein RR49_00311 [Microbacterium ginsengisoli]MBN9209585.1 hypothetical protein [Microbacterium ginsengisoli]
MTPIVTTILVAAVIGLILLAVIALLWEAWNTERTRRIDIGEEYESLMETHERLRSVSASVVDQAKRTVDAAYQVVSAERERGHNARLDILRLIADKEHHSES